MRILVVLVPGFSHLSLGAVLEPLHLAGTLCADRSVDVVLGSLGDLQVPSASGVAVTCDLTLGMCLKALQGPGRPDAMFLCCGLRTPHRAQAAILKVLRHAHRANVAIYGTGCAAWKMADAGILRHGEGTVHWTTLPAFAERHLDIGARDALFVTSDKATSTPGDAAALDMMIAFLRQHFSPDLARQVSNHLLISLPRPGETHQPGAQADALRDAPPKLCRMVDVMTRHLETPLRIRDIAARVDLSPRQAERLFARHLGTTPKGYYLHLRLEQARLLIEQTSLSILEVSLATGFSSRRLLTRCYREAFGFPPTRTRRSP